MRLKNSFKNLKAGILGQIITVFLKFLLRTFFIYSLGVEYLGINGLFGNILTILSLAELGIGNAISYSLYEPLAQKNEEKINQIMVFFKKAYIKIGIMISVVGLGMLPFLDFFVKELPNIPYIKLIFLLFIFNSSCSYFFSYKAILIIADQHNYKVLYNHYMCTSICILIQGISLVVLKNYIIYLVIQIIFTILENIIVSLITEKNYPFLRLISSNKLDKKTFKQIKNNVSALFFHKIGSVIVFSTDNILLSKFFGVALVGVYSNYTLITNSLEGIIKQIFAAVSASIGNLGVMEGKDKQIDTFNVMFLINFWIYTFSVAAVITLINPFIVLWVGQALVLDFSCIIVIIVNFYINGMRNSVQTFKEALGLYKQNQWMPLLESLINLSMSIFLAKRIGPIGVLIGTTVSSVTTCMWIEPWVLFNYGFGKSSIPYMIKYFKFMGFAIFSTVLTYGGSQLIIISGILGLGIKLLYCCVIVNGMMLIAFYNTKEFKYIYSLLNNLKTKK